MKYINIVFEDKEFEFLKEKKGNLSWREFILKLLEVDKKNGRKKK
nr:MAG: hypothetical protein [Lokiarchaeota virus Ratatoskr Meg22_1012]